MAIDHSSCTHPRTPAGRRACRAGAPSARDVGKLLDDSVQAFNAAAELPTTYDQLVIKLHTTPAKQRGALLDSIDVELLREAPERLRTDARWGTHGPSNEAKLRSFAQSARAAIRRRDTGNGPGAVSGCRCGRHGSAAECVRDAYGPPEVFAPVERVRTTSTGTELDRDGRGFDAVTGQPTDVAGGRDARNLLPFDDRCGHVFCGFPRLDHTGGVSCLHVEDGSWKSNVKRDAIAFYRSYPSRRA